MMLLIGTFNYARAFRERAKSTRGCDLMNRSMSSASRADRNCSRDAPRTKGDHGRHVRGKGGKRSSLARREAPHCNIENVSPPDIFFEVFALSRDGDVFGLVPV